MDVNRIFILYIYIYKLEISKGIFIVRSYFKTILSMSNMAL